MQKVNGHFTNLKFPAKEKHRGKVRVINPNELNIPIGQTVWLQRPAQYIVALKNGVRTLIPKEEHDQLLKSAPKTVSTDWKKRCRERRRERADSFVDCCVGV